MYLGQGRAAPFCAEEQIGTIALAFAPSRRFLPFSHGIVFPVSRERERETETDNGITYAFMRACVCIYTYVRCESARAHKPSGFDALACAHPC